jgi:hypothetical protein
MNATKNEIIQRLEIIPNDKLREVLSFLNYLVWQTENPRTQEDIEWLERDLSSLDNYEPYEWQEGELQEGLPVKFIAETGKIEIGV